MQRALFTTYTFTPEWFEATLLPLLRRGNCKQICVILDSTEARSSIRETVSMHGGAAYRIMSVQPKGAGAEKASGGIFHPKVAYIETEDEDFFIVGSGNLTPAGQGRQLEVLDGVKASQEPEVFTEVAAFFNGLRTRLTSLEPEDDEVLKSYAERAASQADKFQRENADEARSAWLVTTLNEVAGDQFARLAKARGATSKLTVLSPFHDAPASAALRLQSEVRASELRIGIGHRLVTTPAPNEPTPKGKKKTVQEKLYLAPFLDSVTKKNTLAFVLPTLPKGELKRKLHAKWFEAQGKSGACVVMTGSVNATQQSLWTCRNVEVSLVRRVSEATTESWAACDIADIHFEPCEYPGSDTASEILHCAAKIVGTEAGFSLIVRFARKVPDDAVRLELRQNGVIVFEKLVATEDGELAQTTLGTDFLQKADGGAIWLRAQTQSDEALTWVNIEPELQNSLETNDLYDVLEGLRRGSSSEELYLKVARALAAILNSRAPTKKKGNADTTGKTGKENLVDAGKEWMHSQGAHGNGSVGKLTKSLSSAIAALALDSDVLMTEDEEETEEPEEDFEDDTEDDEDNGDQAGKRRVAAGKRSARTKAHLRKELICIRERLEELLSVEKKPHPALLEALLPIKLNLDVTPGVLRTEQGGRPTKFTRVLLNLRRHTFSTSLRSQLIPLFATVGVATAALYQMEGRAVPYHDIRSHIEGLTGVPVTEAQLTAWVTATLSNRDFSLPATMRRELLAGLIREICTAEQMELRVKDLLHDAATTTDGQPSIPLADEERALFPDLVRRLKRRKSTVSRISIISRDDVPLIYPCPVCPNPLRNEETATLLRCQILLGHPDCRDSIIVLRKSSASHVDFEI